MHIPGTGSSRISPTAHYTGYTWVRHGLSDERMGTLLGKVWQRSHSPIFALGKIVGLPSLDGMLVSRHLAIDELLQAQIESGAVSQVIELAAGVSGRGRRFCSRYKDLIYIESDLPGMVERKSALLNKIGTDHDRHGVVVIDALATDGPHSLAAVASTLDPNKGLAIITEGLTMYLDLDDYTALANSISETLTTFSQGVYLSDGYLTDELQGTIVNAFLAALTTIVRGKVILHYSSAQAAREHLIDAGFKSVDVHESTAFASTSKFKTDSGALVVKAIEASV